MRGGLGRAELAGMVRFGEEKGEKIFLEIGVK